MMIINKKNWYAQVPNVDKYGVLKIPKDVINISAFCACDFSSVKKIIIPPSVKIINSCFACGCVNLEEIIIPSSTIIGSDFLNRCKNLKKITIQ